MILCCVLFCLRSTNENYCFFVAFAVVVGLFLKNDVDDNRLLAWEDLTR